MSRNVRTKDAARAMVQQAKLAGHQIHHFHGGMRLRHNKKIACETPLARPPMPALLRIPLLQHSSGIPASAPECLVQKGQHVLKGQPIGICHELGGVVVHASTSGIVESVSIEAISHPTEQQGSCVLLRPDGQDTWCETQPIKDWKHSSSEQLLDRINASGIVGLGGAVFPTSHKIVSGRMKSHSEASETNDGPEGGIGHGESQVQGSNIHTLILNGAECEPYISCDEMLMREHPDRIVLGARILRHTLGAERVVIAIEDQMGVVNRTLKRAIEQSGGSNIDIIRVTTIYPEGGERQLIQVLTGLEVPAGGFPSDLGMACINVGTASAVADAVVEGRPLIERVVTVSGPGIRRPRNFVALLGTPISHLVEHCEGYASDAARLILGGPMMGYSLPSDDNPIVKAANCILVLTQKDLHRPQPEMPCINCGECVRVCPAMLLPQQLHWQLRNQLWQDAAVDGLGDCIECGCCDFVCPSHIPLTDRFRGGKLEVKDRESERLKAAHAKNRYQARENRLRRESREQEVLQKKKKHAMRLDAQQRIAAAAERAKSHPAVGNPDSGEKAGDDGVNE